MTECRSDNMNSETETNNIENKTISTNKIPNNLWETITAFSNMDGGYINFGIKPSGERVGVKEEFIDKLQQDVVSLCSSGFNHKLYPDISIEKNRVIKIFIPPVPASLRPIYSSSRGLLKGGKVRIGSTNQSLDDEWIRRFAIAARGGAELQEFPGDYRGLFEIHIIHQYLELIKKKRGNVYATLNLEEILTKLRAITENGVTLFGLLAFSSGYSLQDVTAPTMSIAVTQYIGTSKVNPSDIDEVSLDDKEFYGNAPDQFEGALKFIMSKLPVRSRIDPEGKRRGHFVIPLVALREVLANAISHRDYSTHNSRTQVDIYSNRIEFSNPGRSLVPLEYIETAHSETRNPLLMNFLRDLEITEQRGRGIRTIKSSLKIAGLAESTFEHKGDWFVATIFSAAFIKSDDQVWLSQFAVYKLKERQLNAMVYVLHNSNGITNEIYRDINNMINVRDDRKATKELAKLVKIELLIKKGKFRYTKYVLNRKFSLRIA